MIGVELRAAISRAGAFEAILAASDLSDVLSPERSDHIRDVYQRLEMAAGDGLALLAPLRLTALVHEELPERLPALLERLGLSDYSRIVGAVIGAFGRLWKLQSDGDAVDYVGAHRAYLEPLLLFELAHEGAPTASMRRIAELGGLTGSFERWAARLGESRDFSTRFRRLMTRAAVLATLGVVTVAALALAQSKPSCGEVVTLQTHDRTTTRYAFAPPTAPGEPIAVVLLPGGGGHLDLDGGGCPRALKGNSLVRSIPNFRNLGFATALVDSPSDHVGDDGLGGFRAASQHADDLGKVIADVRARANGLVWLIGTSRGTISAVNAASRLSGAAAPDGIVLTSALMSGAARGARKPWATQSVFDLPLDKIRMPVLVVGHAADACLRSPATLMGTITARTNGAREQVVTVTGGPATAGGQASLDACEGRAPHGFVDQEAEVAAGIARFIRGGTY